jgi:hypothetical protein
MPLSGQCEVYGLEDAERLSFVARHEEMEMAAICGRPAPDVIRSVISLPPSPETVLCPPEDRRPVAEALPDWRSELATIYRLANGGQLPEVPTDAVRLLSLSEIEAMNHAPAELEEELIDAATRSPVEATFVGSVAKNILATFHGSDEPAFTTTSCVVSEFLQQFLSSWPRLNLDMENGTWATRGQVIESKDESGFGEPQPAGIAAVG